MDTFKLDYRLENDCIKLGYLEGSMVLLMNNSLVPWLILVPVMNSESSVYEFDLLPREHQISLLDQINQLSGFLRYQFQFDKLNIATIGNIVQQLHVHIVARSENDYCWPAVVWGAEGRKCWSEKEVIEINQQLASFLTKNYKSLHSLI